MMNKQVEKPSTVSVLKSNKNGNCQSKIKSQCISNQEKKNVTSYDAKKGHSIRYPMEKPSKPNRKLVNKPKETANAKCSVEYGVDLAAPSLCSTLQLASEIQASSIENHPSHTVSQLRDLKDLNTNKASKHVNIPFTKHIFQNLVDLQISDDDFNSGKKTSKAVHLRQKKDQVFDLSSYYKPDFSTEFCAKPKVIPQEMEYVQHYNGCELYDRIESITCI